MHYSINISVETTQAMNGMIAASVADARALMPNQAHAIQRLAQMAHRRWLEYASGKRALPSGRQMASSTGSYMSSIKIEDAGELKYVIYSDDPKAAFIEEGFPAFDMKKILMTSDRVRKTKDGRKYLIVPFRHKMPGGGALGVVIPQEAAAFWLAPNRKSSMVTGHYLERSQQDGSQKLVTRQTYHWGDRMSRGDLEGMGLDPDSKIGNRLLGMVRFANNEDKGGQKLTFRVMVEGGKGWLMPRREGNYPAKSAYEWMLQNYEAVMKTALDEDIRRMGGR